MTKLEYKPGVSGQPSAEIQRAIDVAASIYASYGVPFVVTSLRDGQHSKNSLHYSGNAVDLRRWDLDSAGKTSVAVSAIRSQLGGDFNVILESDHIHIEYDPKGSSSTGGGSSLVLLAFAVAALLLLKR